MSIKIVLVGTDSREKIRVARTLQSWNNFTRFAMLDGVKRVYGILYKRGTFIKVSSSVKYDYYDAFYEVNKNAWLSYLYQREEKTDKNIVVPDARYVYEVQELQKRGYYVVRLMPDPEAKRRRPRILSDNKAGTVYLYEHFPSGVGYKAQYQITTYKDIEKLKDSLNIMVNSLEHQQF